MGGEKHGLSERESEQTVDVNVAPVDKHILDLRSWVGLLLDPMIQSIMRETEGVPHTNKSEHSYTMQYQERYSYHRRDQLGHAGGAAEPQWC